MRPERRRALLAAAPEPDEDQTAWLLTFSDLVLQLFAFALVVAVLARAATPTAAPSPPPPPVATREPSPADAMLPRMLVAQAFGSRELPEPEAEPVAVTAPLPEPTPVAAPVAEPTPADAPPAVPLLLAAAGRALETIAATSGRGDAVRVSVRESDVVLTISDAIVFPSGSADLLPGAQPILREIQRLASTMPDLGLEVAGHTDDVPIHTTAFPSNLELSLARAARVARELAADDPLLLARTVATGVGPYRPVASNAEAGGRERNRRVEIRLVPRG